MNCSICQTELSQELKNAKCPKCHSRFKLNLDLLAKLVVIFMLPAAFLVKGTGSFWYLLSGLIGAAIYLFNMKYVRDETYLLRIYEEKKMAISKLESAISGVGGYLDFLVNNTESVNQIKIEKGAKANLLTLISKQANSTPLDPINQMKLLYEIVPEDSFKEFCESYLESLRNTVLAIETYHKDLIPKS